MYDVNDYGRMLADPMRMNAYVKALERTVKPSSVVVDVGTGIGAFAMLAARLGARKVYAIDTNPCIELARATAKRNGLEKQIEFIQKSVFDVELPEKADVLVSDCRGNFALYDASLEIVIHARDRFLQPGGTMIAQKDELFASLLHRRTLREDLEAPWKLFGLDWSDCRASAFTSAIAEEKVPSLDTQLTDAVVWSTLEYTNIASPDVRSRVTARATRSGVAHAVGLWFRTTTIDDVRIDSSRCYGSMILPLDPPMPVVAGESVDLRINALKARTAYVFSCQVRTATEERRLITDGLEKVALLRKSIIS